MKTAVCCIVVLVCALFVEGQAKKADIGWEAKPVDQWNNKDVSYILNDSPWSRTWEGLHLISVARLRLQSALTVRLALLRKRQLSESYDSMDAKAKTAFNRKHKAILECPLCEKFYVVAIMDDRGVLSSPLLVKGRAENIYLSNEKGQRRALARFIPQTAPGGGSEALFLFPRNNEKGEPLLTPENKTLVFNFQKVNDDDDPLIHTIERVYIDVRDIVRDGKVIF